MRSVLLFLIVLVLIPEAVGSMMSRSGFGSSDSEILGYYDGGLTDSFSLLSEASVHNMVVSAGADSSSSSETQVRKRCTLTPSSLKLKGDLDNAFKTLRPNSRSIVFLEFEGHQVKVTLSCVQSNPWIREYYSSACSSDREILVRVNALLKQLVRPYWNIRKGGVGRKVQEKVSGGKE